MKFVTLDFESFYSDDYTLSKLTTESYIRDPRFEAHGAAIKWQHNIPARWYAEKELRHVLKQHDWSDTMVIHHHAQFDGLILSHHYDVHPNMFGCTLAMARLLIGNHLSVSLDSVRKHFGMPPKTTPYNLFKGNHWHEMDARTQQLVGEGAEDEVESIFKLFARFMREGFVKEELEVVDTTIKMFTESCLRADILMLADLWEAENKAKHQRLIDLNITTAELQSSEKFAELLRAEAIEPETKESTKGNTIYAFAKTDSFMRDLLEHDDERVRALAEARIGAKSTLLQTRAETLGGMARRGPMPVYLNYCGAHTTRWSGGDKANWQNFKRADPDNPKLASPLRRAIMAPEGYLLAPVDLAQIEYRVLCFLADEQEALQELREGRDPYVELASEVYGFQVTKAHPAERGTGKQLKLSCGFQAGDLTIKKTAALGIYGPPVHITIEEAGRWKGIYRKRMHKTTRYWKEAGHMISRLAGGDPLQWGPMQIREGKIWLPNGCPLHYPELQYHVDRESGEQFWRYKNRHGWTKLYSGKLTENVVQALARLVMSQAMVRLTRLGYRILNTTHDELLVLLKKDGNEQKHLDICLAEMKRTPTWLPHLPLDVEAFLGERYSK